MMIVVVVVFLVVRSCGRFGGRNGRWIRTQRAKTVLVWNIPSSPYIPFTYRPIDRSPTVVFVSVGGIAGSPTNGPFSALSQYRYIGYFLITVWQYRSLISE